MLDEPGVDVDRGHMSATSCHPFDQRSSARADLEALPAAADAEFVEKRLAAGSHSASMPEIRFRSSAKPWSRRSRGS